MTLDGLGGFSLLLPRWNCYSITTTLTFLVGDMSMLTISGSSGQGQPLHRRGFLRIGSLGLGGLLCPALLSSVQAAKPKNDHAVILFWMAGGPSHIDTYDMKPDAPAEVRGPFQSLPTTLPGWRVNELMPRHAQIAKHVSIVRSLHHTLSVHDDGSHWVQTGYPLLNARQQGQKYPAQGAVVSRHFGPSERGVPPYVCIPESYSSPKGFYQKASFLGGRYDPVSAGGDPSLGNFRKADFTLPADLTFERLEQRRELLQLLDDSTKQLEKEQATQKLDRSRQEAFDLLSSQRTRDAFDLSREPLRLREKYGRNAYGQSALLARRLVEAGVRYVTINLYEADVDWWDDHYTIEKNLRKRLPIFDQAVGSLIEELQVRGLADRVLVAAFGEFGRGPTIDKNEGRSHWTRAYSALLSGCSIRPGQLIGCTTSNGGEPKDRALGPGDLLLTMYRALGMDLDTMLPDQQGRPTRLVECGDAIRELF